MVVNTLNHNYHYTIKVCNFKCAKKWLDATLFANSTFNHFNELLVLFMLIPYIDPRAQDTMGYNTLQIPGEWYSLYDGKNL